MIVVRAEERYVEVAGARGEAGDQVDSRRKVGLGVEAGHQPAPAAALRAATRQARSQQHLQQYHCN